MREYLEKIKRYSEALCTSAKWHNSEKTVGSLSTRTANACDYIYEFFCYLSILGDLNHHYELEYYSGAGEKQNLFPKGPSDKEGHPFFFVVDKISKQRLLQVCAGTKVESKLLTKRAPDISFQSENACLKLPKYSDVKMIYDTKRKRPDTTSKSLGESQFAYFAIMIKELGQENAHANKYLFNNFKEFNGNCLITNSKARRGDVTQNQFHAVKEVENFDDLLDLKKINVIG